jgi:hypothetical protein
VCERRYRSEIERENTVTTKTRTRRQRATGFLAATVLALALAPASVFAATANTSMMTGVAISSYAGDGSTGDPFRILVAPTAHCAPSAFWTNSGVTGAGGLHCIPDQLALQFEQRGGNTDSGTLISSWAFELANRNPANLNETWVQAFRLCPLIAYSTGTGGLRFGVASKGDFSPYYFSTTTLDLNVAYMTRDLGSKQLSPGDSVVVRYYGGYVQSETSRGTDYAINLATTDTRKTYAERFTVDADGFISIDALPHGGNYQVGCDFSGVDVVPIPDQSYTGSALTPVVAVRGGETTLTAGVDYTVAYSGNVQPGTATAVVTGLGSWVGAKTITFCIAGTAASEGPGPAAGNDEAVASEGSGSGSRSGTAAPVAESRSDGDAGGGTPTPVSSVSSGSSAAGEGPNSNWRVYELGEGDDASAETPAESMGAARQLSSAAVASLMLLFVGACTRAAAYRRQVSTAGLVTTE